MQHWAAKYTKLKYAAGGRGPDKVDCWGLLRMAYQQEFCILLPDLPGVTGSAFKAVSAIEQGVMSDWIPIKKPFDGCAVALSQRGDLFHHVGVFAREGFGWGRVIHCWGEMNVIADDKRGLYLRGFQTVAFYQHRLWPTS